MSAPASLPSAAELDGLNTQLAAMPTEDVLGWAWQRFGARAGIGTSFQGAGLVIIHMARARGYNFPIFTLDTGLLFPETVALKSRLEEFFKTSIEALQPDLTVQQQEEALGPALWERDPDQCCTLRKVMPLQNKLADLDCWMTGLRRQQSDTREGTGILELYVADASTGREIAKLNPLAAWSRESVWNYLRQHKIPYNPLHDQGYRSIGCQPCTKLSSSGEHERAGRWTGFGKTECGIHTFMARKG